MGGAAGAVLADSLGGGQLVYGNEGREGFRYDPARLAIVLTADALRRRYPDADAARLIAPEGWEIVGGDGQRALGGETMVAWELLPGNRPASFAERVACEVFGGGRLLGTLHHAVPIELRGRSQFDPERHIPPFRNSADDLGHVEPRRDLFRQTYRRGGALLPNAFFEGLYRDIVFLTPEADARGGGGLCTGMARFALGVSLGQAPGGEVRALAGGGRAAAMEAVQAWHGRQLTDRALLAAARQFLDPSPAAAFRHFRAGVLDGGRGEVAFDVGIARWEWSPGKWPALLARLVAQGHTVVPYAFRQASDDAAEVAVYDPNHPDRAEWPESVVRFDLANDRYAYRGFGALDRDDGTTVLAMPQESFAGDGTAYLASLANLALHPELLAREWRENGALRRNVALVGGGLVMAVLAMRQGRGRG